MTGTELLLLVLILLGAAALTILLARVGGPL